MDELTFKIFAEELTVTCCCSIENLEVVLLLFRRCKGVHIIEQRLNLNKLKINDLVVCLNVTLFSWAEVFVSLLQLLIYSDWDFGLLSLVGALTLSFAFSFTYTCLWQRFLFCGWACVRLHSGLDTSHLWSAWF